MPVVDARRTISLGQPVEVRDVEAGGLHLRQHGFRRRRGGGGELHDMRQRLFLLRRGVEQRRHHDRRAAQMRHLVGRDRVEDRRRAHCPQADMGAGDNRQRPGKAPAVAMKHRQRPQIDRMLGHAAGQHVAHGEQIRAAMMIDDALGIAGRAGRVVERNRIPLVARHLPGELGIAFAEKFLVFEAAQAFACAGEFRIVIVDDQRPGFGAGQRLFHHLGIFAIDDEHFQFGVIEREAENGAIEPRIERVKHGARHRHSVMRFDHRRRIGEHDGDGVAALDAAPRQRRRQLPGARIELPVIPGPRAMHDRGLVRINRGRAFKKRQRRQRLEIRRIAVEIKVVGCRHGRRFRGNEA